MRLAARVGARGGQDGHGLPSRKGTARACWSTRRRAAPPRAVAAPPQPHHQNAVAAGMLQLAPVVSPPDEHLRSAAKRAARVAPSAAIKNEAEKERNRAARQLDTLMKELSVPLTRWEHG